MVIQDGSGCGSRKTTVLVAGWGLASRALGGILDVLGSTLGSGQCTESEQWPCEARDSAFSG